MSTETEAQKEHVIKRVTIVLPEEIHSLGKDLARADHRDFSGEVAALIEAESKRKKEGVAA